MFLQVCGSRGPQRIVLGYGGGPGGSGLERFCRVDTDREEESEREQGGGRAAVLFKKRVEEIFSLARDYKHVVW